MLELVNEKDLAIGFDDCNTDIGEMDSVKAYLKTWNPYIISSWCFTYRFNLAAKDEILEINLFKDFKYQVYQLFKNSAVKVIIFRKLVMANTWCSFQTNM